MSTKDVKNTQNTSGGTNQGNNTPELSRDDVIRNITNEYLNEIDIKNPPSPSTIQATLLKREAREINQINAKNANTKQNKKNTSDDDSEPKWVIPTTLYPAQIADIIMKLYHVVNIAYGGLSGESDFDVLAVYCNEGRDKGIYVSDDKTFWKIIHDFGYTLTKKDTDETLQLLSVMAPRCIRNEEENLIAVNDCIINTDTLETIPFTPDKIFVSKCRTNWNPNAQNVIIHDNNDNTDWDIETWMIDLFDGNKEISELVWQIIGAIIRPNIPWNKCAWFYSDTGNNGKGTLCELMRQITGEGSYASIPLTDFSKRFMLEPLIRSSAIIVDENDVGIFIDKAANLKAIITNDVIQMDRKFKTPCAYRFKGFMVQCINELPRIKDKSGSFYRRQIIVPFTKCFTGNEKPYIKHDYLHRQDVLEYVLWRVLSMHYNELTEPEICKMQIEQYKEFNDPIRQFVNEILPLCVWDLLPYNFLFDLYKSWFRETSPSGTIQGKNTFISDIKKTLAGSDTWFDVSNIRPKNMMDKSEPLIATYKLQEWMDPVYKGQDRDRMCHPQLRSRYNGIQRYANAPKPVDNNNKM